MNISARFASVVLILAGCGSSPDTTDAHVAPACATDPRVETYAVGLTQSGAMGDIKLSLSSMSPVTDVMDNYQWTVTLTDPSGAPLNGATMTVVPWMPDHGHGTSIVPTVTGTGNGVYSVANVYLFMAGVWTVTFHITLASGSTDTAVFTVCIGDG